MSLQSSLHSKAVAWVNLKRSAPTVIGNKAQNFFRRSFELQGFTDKGLVKWAEVQRRKPGTPAFKYPKKNAADRHARGILIGIRTKGGIHLRDAVSRSLKSATFDRILFTVPVAYAAVHNEGLVMRNGSKMPQRKFIGNSQTLMTWIDTYMKGQLSKLK